MTKKVKGTSAAKSTVQHLIIQASQVETYDVDVPIFQREGVIDRNGYMLTAEALKNMDRAEVPIFLNFDYSKQIGVAVIDYKEGQGLGAKMKIMKNTQVRGLYPCLGFKVSKSKKVDDHFEYLGDSEALSIGICLASADAGAKPI